MPGPRRRADASRRGALAAGRACARHARRSPAAPRSARCWLSSTAAVLCIGVTNVGEVVLAREVLGLGGSGLAMLVDRRRHRHGPRLARRPLQAGAWQWRRAYMVGLALHGRRPARSAPLAPALPSWCSVFVLGGFGNGFALVHDRLLLAAAVPDALHGRVFALQKALHLVRLRGLLPRRRRVLIAATGVQHAFLVAGVADARRRRLRQARACAQLAGRRPPRRRGRSAGASATRVGRYPLLATAR